ncbi:hypothetical protein J3459_006521 [Metarhizium acridum]|uniref:uncharacterized protein n=1 Tax=Metarhizium acridum TaxID=92637 RepID=UPI001C6AAF08|nr:hypothetical protein J3458_005082 [Metarhizium acridum]KAG8427596.1 hypothetical protein J3459_006521 [Metarhizium acridum]
MLAARKGHEEVVRLLLRRGADTGVRYDGLRPLCHAIKNGHEAVAKLLIENSDGPYGLQDSDDPWERKNYVPNSLEHINNTKGLDSDDSNWLGRLLFDWERHEIDRIPLLCCINYGHEGIYKLLVEKGVNPELYGLPHSPIEMGTWWRPTNLFTAAEQGNLDAVSNLIVKGANLECAVYTRSTRYGNLQWQTPLSRAAEQGHMAVVTRLLEMGANLEGGGAPNPEFPAPTPLWCAAKEGQQDMFELLVQKGAKLQSVVGRQPYSYYLIKVLALTLGIQVIEHPCFMQWPAVMSQSSGCYYRRMPTLPWRTRILAIHHYMMPFDAVALVSLSFCLAKAHV